MRSVALFIAGLLFIRGVSTGQQIPKEILEKLKTEKLQTPQVIDTAGLKKKVEKARKAALAETKARSVIEKSIGGGLSQFGYDIFPSMPIALTFQNVPVSPDYVVGPSDNLVIYIWGNINQQLSLTVDRDGKIVLPEAGVLYVWGKKFSEVKRLIIESLKSHYSGISVEVSLGALRTFPVYLMGEVVNPGIYKITPLINPLQALTLAGGVRKTGSLRKIKIIKSTGGKVTLDLYKLLVEGKELPDVVLEGGDIIFVPPIGNVAGIAGAVKRPAIYELKDGESLYDLIELAGGLLPTAFIYRVQVDRVVRGERRSVMDVEFRDLEEFRSKGSKFIVENGDLVSISTILPGRWNFVTIRGNVYKPGDYELKKGWRVLDLINAALGVKKGTFLENAEIYRYLGKGRRELLTFNLRKLLEGDSTQNIELEQWDIVRIYSEDEVLPKDSVRVVGAVGKPGLYPLLENMKIKDLLFMAGNLLPEADSSKGELFRMVSRDSFDIIRLDFRDSLALNMGLKRNDVLSVKFVPAYFDRARVYLGGSVRFPGWYYITKGQTFGDVIRRAGGFKNSAFPEGIVLIRKSIGQMEKSGTERFNTYLRASMMQASMPYASATSVGQGGYDLTTYFQFQKQIVNDLTKLFQPGRIFVDFSDTSNWVLELQDGDSIYVPDRPHSVQVLGAVRNPGAVMYEEGKGAMYYVNCVGGFSEDADKKALYVIGASGIVRSSRGKIREGDTIVVPPKLKTPTRLIIKDVTTILSQMAIIIVSLYQLVK